MEGFEKRSEWLWPLSRVLGLLPMSFRRCQCSGRVGPGRQGYGMVDPPKRCLCSPLAPSASWLVYSLLLLVAVVSWTSMLLYARAPDASPEREVNMVDRDNGTTGRATNHFVGLFDTSSITVIAAVCILQAATTQHLVLKLAAQLRRVDGQLHHKRYDVPRWLMAFLVCLSFVIFLDIIYKLCDDWRYPLSSVPSYISYLVTYVREAMFVDDVTSVCSRFRTLNGELEGCLSANKAADFRVGRATANEKKGKTITRLAAAYDSLCQCGESVASQYSLFLLCDMLGLLVRLVITTYFIIGIVVPVVSEDGSATPQRTLFIVIQVMWLVGHVVRMFVLVTPCTKTMEETNRTGALVSSSVSYDPLDSQLSMQLKSLSVHLLHRKIAFSAFGVFDLNLPLVCSVMSAVTTYLVVLIQLRMSSE